jgi:hypothetical protein
MSEPANSGGYLQDVVLPLSAFTLDSGAGLGTTAAGNVYRAAQATNLRGISWDAAADGTDIIRCDYTLPSDFHYSVSDVVGTRPMVQMLLRWRLVDLAATSNTTLNLLANAQWHPAGWTQDSTGRVVTEVNGPTALSTLAANLSVNVGGGATPADVADATEEGLRWATYDFTAAMTAAQRKALTPMTTFQMFFFPSAAIGANLRLDITSAIFRYRRHAQPAYRPWRQLA